MSKVAVVVPFHKETLNVFEQISLAQVQKVLSKYPIIFAVPEGTNFNWIPAGYKVMQFPYLGGGVKKYDILLTSKIFYGEFLEYDYVLIYHLDAFVFDDKLEYFCSLGYDNIGASWPRNGEPIIFNGENFRPRVGNGGFCLRNPKSCCEFLKNHPDWAEEWRQLPDDVFWGVAGMIKGSGFRTAPISVAYKFAAEYNPVRCVKKNGGELPFGCHAWHNFCADFYIKVFANYGYNLLPFKNQMKNTVPNNWLMIVLQRRLIRRINNRQSLMYYLPKIKFNSVRVIRSPYTMVILDRLLLENNFLSDKIYLYNQDELEVFINNLRPENSPHLIITHGVGSVSIPFVEILAKKGMFYGLHFFDFHREYLNNCVKIFHNIGK